MQETRGLLPMLNPSHLWGCFNVVVSGNSCRLSGRVLLIVAGFVSLLPLLHKSRSV